MKKSIILLICVLSHLFLYCQENLVPNGNFDSNPGNYQGGTDPVAHYTQGSNCVQGRQTFESEISNWKVAETNASLSELNAVDNFITRRCSPDWMAPGTTDNTNCAPIETTFYVASGYIKESIMVELKDGYKLVKGRSYKFRIKVRFPIHAGSFQVVFSAKKEGLNCAPKWKWVAVDTYLGQSCDWTYIESYFTVPTDNDKKYEDMKYLVLQYNNDHQGEVRFPIHYDDVFLAEGQKCEDIKYIQDWQYYNEHKIEQANLEIRAGAHVSPFSWPAQNPVIVKSNAMVIYRAPSIYLEPGFFVEEPGSYFETQVGTCVVDPCPQIPDFSPPDVLNCSSPIILGEGLPGDVPGVFYSWEPENAFENPWSNMTNFVPDQGGCLDANLTIWTICGASQSFPFSIRYFDNVPAITLSNLNQTSNGINLNASFSNTENYSIKIIDVLTNNLLYEETTEVACGSEVIPINITHCNVPLCQNLIVQIVASNSCYGETIETIQWQPPVFTSPTISIHNLNSDDFNYQFDLDIPENYENVTIELWDNNLTSLICSQSYSQCSNPIGNSSLHFNVKNCISGCMSQCQNYKVKISIKNFCSENITEEILEWNKTTTVFGMPSSYPNVITLDNDGINETLCFSPVAADYYHLVVVDRWGITTYESSGCVNQNPVCLWTPAANTDDGTYFYTISFSNQCGQSDELTNFVQVWNNLSGMIVSNETNLFENLEEDIAYNNVINQEITSRNSGLYVYPNPTDNDVYIISNTNDEFEIINIYDSGGRLLDTYYNTNKVSLQSYSAGMYYLDIKGKDGVYLEKIVKK